MRKLLLIYSRDRFSKKHYLLVVRFKMVDSDAIFPSLQRTSKFHAELHQIHTMQIQVSCIIRVAVR